MDAADFQFIESKLGVVLPRAFTDFMRRFPNNRLHRLENGCGEIPANAELFAIGQLQLFNNDRGFDFYELQPSLRSNKFMDIGDDGCGNPYCMVGNDRASDDLWMWEHDPYNGFTPCDRITLRDYFGPEWSLVAQPDALSAIPSDGTIISRADHPFRSIFIPITMDEWRAYVEADSRLALDENHEVPHPFRKEVINVRRWPGRARLTTADGVAHVSYFHGRLVLSPIPRVAQEHEEVMQRIARDLKARLF
jgi:hypothetical protein